MRRFIAVLIAVSILFPVAAQATTLEGPREKQWKQCQLNWMRDGTWTQFEEEKTARCVINRWGIPGGYPKLWSVIDCESGWNRFAYNPNGHVGLAQHNEDSWDSRVIQYKPHWWDLKAAWTNSRTHIVVTVLMVLYQGWGPWSCT